ncbi:MAG TPA: M48 family metalloprotease [Nocardioidaceae bacterium]|nr:M48 family metalloprotease [Nocardioidaceae bacterium]
MSLNRRAGWLTAGGSLVVFVVLAALLVPWDPVPGGELQAAAPLEVFTREQIALAEEYATTRRYLGWASYAVSLVVAGILGFTSLGARLVKRVFGRRRWWLVVPGAVLLVLAIGRLATLPFSILVQRRNLEYGLTEQGWDAWAVDYGKSLLVAWVLTSLVLLVMVFAARRSPRMWFAWAGGFAAALTVAGSFLYPVVLEPVFNEFEPLGEGPLRTSVLQLADEMDVAVDDVLVADASRRTTTLNAYVSGFGSTRRVVLYDNLVNDLPPAEARVVVAHELAHAKYQDVVVGTSLGAVGAVLGVALLALVLDSRRVRRRAHVAGPADPAAVPLVLALAAVAMLLVSPVQSTISRAIEVRADRESLMETGESDTFVSMQRELALASLNDPTPPAWSHFWFGTHPTVLQRAGLPASLAAAR